LLLGLFLLSLPALAQDPGATIPPRGDGKADMLRGRPDSPRMLQPRVGDERDANTDVLHYFLDLEVIPENQWIAGSNTMTVRSMIDLLTTFRFRLDTILDITEMRVGATPVTWTQVDDATVEVTLDRAYQVDEQFELYVAYQGHPHSAGGMGSITFGFRPPGVWFFYTLSQPWYSYTWWPAKDDLRDKTTADLWFTVAGDLNVASNGTRQGVDDLGDGRFRHRWRTDYPTDDYLYCVGVDNYTEFGPVWEYDGHAMPLQFFIRPESDTPENRDAWLATAPMLTTYSDLFGIYPFVNEKYGMLEWDFMGGMEHQTMTGILGGFMGFFWETGIAHELAHQWWGDDITCDTWRDIWLNEGFADYCEALWAQYKPGSSGEAALHQMMNGDLRPGSIDGTVYCYDISDEDRIFDYDLSYRKAGWVLHMLRHVLGDATFFDALRVYRAAYEGRTATTAGFQSAVEYVAGRDLDWFFQEWIYLPGAPAYQYAWQQRLVGGTRYVELFLRQTQSNIYPIFAMPVDIRVNQPDGAIHAVWNDARAEHLLFPVGPATVSGIDFDPVPWILWTGATPTTFVEGPPKIVSAYPAPNDTLGSPDVTSLTVSFHKPVLADSDDFSLAGESSGTVPFTFEYDLIHQAAILTPLAPLAIDAYTLTVSDGIVDLGSSQALDGELVRPDGVNTLPSGDGLPGGPTILHFVITDSQDAPLVSEGLTGGARLLGASPNPLSRRTEIDLAMEQAGRARLSVYDASGRRVRTLMDANLPAGTRRVTWGADDDAGEPVACGVYFVRLDAFGSRRIAKLMLVR
jgi:hypothetical protein